MRRITQKIISLPFTAILFQENLLKTMIQMENTFFALAERFNRDCIIICDRGAMDASACESNFFLIIRAQQLKAPFT